MGAVRAASSTPFLLLGLVLAGCGAARHTAPATTPATPVDVGRAGARTIAGGTARFTLAVGGTVSGLDLRADERGSVAFDESRAHIYKLLPAGGIPQEQIVDGPYVYTNGNVEAAMADSRIKPWTRLDTRRLSPARRRANGNELAHVRAPAYLIEGVAKAQRVGAGTGLVHVRGVVDPARLDSRVPKEIAAAVAADFAASPFPADFWLDARGRVRRVHVSYRSGTSGRIVVDATYSGFGAPVQLG